MLIAEPSRLIGHDQIDDERQLEAPGQGEAVDPRDDGDGQCFQAIEHAVPKAHELVPLHGIRRQLAHRLEVGARAEGAPRGGERHRAHGGASLHLVAHPVEVLEQRRADGVELRRAVQDDAGDPAVDAEFDGSEVHRMISCLAAHIMV